MEYLRENGAEYASAWSGIAETNTITVRNSKK